MPAAIAPDQTPPRAAAIFESLRAFGYDLPTALADLVDNSISAEARHIDIHCEWAGADSVIRVIDDGRGMDDAALVEAMRLGGGGPLSARAPHDLGRFGLGLKTASLSQCRRLTVRSRRAGSPAATRRWDLDALDDWSLHRDAAPSGETWLAPLDTMPRGTVVLWENLDRLTRGQRTDDAKQQDRFLERIDGLRLHLGMVFHRLLTGPAAVVLRVNGHPVEPWDPFMEAHTPQNPCNERLRLDGETIPVRGYILPHASKLSPDELKKGGGPRGWLSHQGFYVYRRDRLLVAGDWLGLGWKKDAHFQLLRIAIDLPNTLDHAWQINVVKSRAIPPAGLRERLRDIAAILREARRRFTPIAERASPPRPGPARSTASGCTSPSTTACSTASTTSNRWCAGPWKTPPTNPRSARSSPFSRKPFRSSTSASPRRKIPPPSRNRLNAPRRPISRKCSANSIEPFAVAAGTTKMPFSVFRRTRPATNSPPQFPSMKNSHAPARNMAASGIREHLPEVEPDEKSSENSRMTEASAETKAVAAILHDLRLERCLTVAQLAAHSGLAELDVAELEGARREATVLDLVALARSLGTSVEDILRRARV